MDRLKQKFKDDPAFAVGVLVTGAVVLTGVLNAVAKNVTAGTYAYRAHQQFPKS